MRSDSPIAQSVERRTVNPQVPGSSPGWRAIYSSIAQLVERRTVNPQVPGSSPGGRAKILKKPIHHEMGFFMPEF